VTAHELKIRLGLLDAILDRRKTWEVRWAKDRDFQVGDQLTLREWKPSMRPGAPPAEGVYTGRTGVVRVTYVANLGAMGLPGYVGMSIEPVSS
jgi:hypothetical protein